MDILESVRRSSGTLMLHKEYTATLESAKINGHFLQTAEECDIILHQTQLMQLRNKCAKYWDALMCGAGVPAFFELAFENPETVADNWIPFIFRFLDWYQSDFELLLDKMNLIGIPGDILLQANPSPICGRFRKPRSADWSRSWTNCWHGIRARTKQLTSLAGYSIGTA